MMYDELEKYLSGYLFIDYWYDEGVDIAREMISDFKECDWELMHERLPLQDIEWKKKIAYCLYDHNNKHELLTLLELLDTEDEKLLEICLDTLRNFVDKEIASFFTDNHKIICRIKKLYYDSSRPTQIMLEDLMKKINEYTKDKGMDCVLEG